MIISSNTPEKTMEIGRKLGALLAPGSVVCLKGDLGAGKTQFAKGVAQGLEVQEHVTSPTFTIINEYEGRLPFYHVDAYRLEEEDEAYELGLEEYLYGKGVTLIEWPDRISSLLPAEYLAIDLNRSWTDESFRELVLSSLGQRYERLLVELAGLLSGEIRE